MMIKGPKKAGIPPDMSAAGLGVLDHFALVVSNIEESVTLLTNGERLSGSRSSEVGRPTIGRDAKWQFNLFDPDGIRTELMEFKPASKPVLLGIRSEVSLWWSGVISIALIAWLVKCKAV